ncbi:MAG: hypothetical protein LJF04_04755 [Gemmatimonadetes bacterium]|nr:hypothetical protein [Gemmatimonadota bacterium]
MRRRLLPAALAVAGILFLGVPGTQAQALAQPVLQGRVLLGDSVLREGRVVVHHVSSESQGQVDSTRIRRDGTFSVQLPSMPDSTHHEIYFASVRHDGILYFGPALTVPIQLDSTYEIRTWDTTVVAKEGTPLTIEVRNIFLEQDSTGTWRITDLFQLRNDGKRTLVAAPGGIVWRYPLAAGATNAEVAPTGDVASDAMAFENGDLVIRAPLSPGKRLFAIQYDVPDPYLNLRLPGITEHLDILVREPAPPLDVPGFTAMDRIQLEPGTTYRRYAATQIRDGAVKLTQGTPPRSPPVRWYAVVLSMILAGAGLWAFRKGAVPVLPRPARGVDSRHALLVEIAQLDEAFAARGDPSVEERKAYEAGRRELLRRLRLLG